MSGENTKCNDQPAGERSCPAPAGSPSDTPETDILHDHCHIDNTPAPEAIETWVDKCKKLERERDDARAIATHIRMHLGPKQYKPYSFPWENERDVS